jgi:hypothetical protein
MPDAATIHDWIAVTAPNGDRGFQCSRCNLTAIHLPVPASLEHCPPQPPIPTLAQLLQRSCQPDA